MLKRPAPTEPATTCSMVRTPDTGWLGSICASAFFTAPSNEVGAEAVRTTMLRNGQPDWL